MDFGSDYVLLYDTQEHEYISEEEYEVGMNVSDSDSDSDEREYVPMEADSTVMADCVSGAPPPPMPARNFADSTVMADCVSGAPPPPMPARNFDVAAEQMMQYSQGAPPPAQQMMQQQCSVVPPPPPPAHARPHFQAFRASKPARKKHHWKGLYEAVETPKPSGNKVRKGDTNVVAIKLNKLKSPSNMHAGDPNFCTSCAAILTKISKLTADTDDKVWECEFCSHQNTVDVEDEEVPKEEDVTFMLEPAPSTVASGPSGLDESLVIFCVDTSGSMCVTTEVPGNVKLRGAHSTRSIRHMHGDRSDQFLPHQRRNVTYISRLQSVQAAIDHQLQEMEQMFPNKRVAIVTFCNEVCVIGDGKSEPVSIAGDKLFKKETLETLAAEQALPDSIKSSRKQLGDKLFELEECGPTALGPALVVATKMAARVRGSKVILCTDGLANIGIGKLDQFKNEQEEEESLKFYTDMSQSAVDDGVSISVITIKGTDCKLVELGKLADKTGGQVNIVDPLKLTQQFSTILANQIIATNVVATFILHKRLFFFYEDTEESKIVRNIGNATEDTEISFEYGVRTGKKDKGQTTPQGDPIAGCSSSNQPEVGGVSGVQQMDTSTGGTEELPFQLQITYTDTEGAKALRVITQLRPVTRDRKQAERKAKLDVLAHHTARQASDFALEGKYTQSRERALVNQRVAWRHTREAEEGETNVAAKKNYKKKFGKIKAMENYLNVRQHGERARSGGRTLSDSEDNDMEEEEAEAIPKEKSKSRSKYSWIRKKRSAQTEDAGAALVYQGQGKAFFNDSDSD